MKRVFSRFIVFYRLYLSPLFPRSCRYYPTCSQYALDHFEFSNFFYALFASTLRILRCNQLFRGGIDYPIVRREFRLNLRKNKAVLPKVWFVPYKKNQFYLIRVFDSLKEK